MFFVLLQVADVKQIIETAQGADVYPASKQMLIHQGKVLKDATTLEENQVAESSFIVIMLSKVSCCVCIYCELQSRKESFNFCVMGLVDNRNRISK